MRYDGKRWLVLAAGVVMMLFAGVIYAWSILKAPLAAEFGWESGALGLNFTITMCFFCAGGILGGSLTKKIPPHTVLRGAALMTFAGFAAASRVSGGIAALYAAYGVMCGLGIGIAYNVVISTVLSWFPDRRATASGAMMMGFGASSLVLGPPIGYLMGAEGWRAAYVTLGAGIFAVLFTGSFLMKIRGGGAEMSAESKNGRDFSAGEMIRSASFWKFYLFGVLTSSIGSCVISFAMDASLAHGAGRAGAVMFVGALSVCNGLGRVLTGWLFDSFGRARAMTVSALTSVAAASIMLCASYIGSLPALAAGFAAAGLAYGSAPPLTSGYVGSMYGRRHFAVNFSIANTLLMPASFAAAIAGAMINAMGGYMPVFGMLLVFSVAGFAINLNLSGQ